MIRTRIANALLVLSFLSCAGVAAAEESRDVHPLVTADWWVDVGSYFPDRKLTLSVDGTVGGIDNEEHEFDQKLGLSEREPLFEAQIGWQFGEKWGVAVQYFESSRKNKLTLEEDIEWEDVVHEVGAEVTGGTKMSVTRVVFSRRFYNSGPHDFSLAAGVHLLDISAFIAGQARLDDMSTEYRKSQSSASAPLPNVGAWYRYSPSKKWLFSVRADWLEATIDDTSGQILNLMGEVNYSLFDNVGIGLGYQRFSIDVSLDHKTWNGTADLTFSGPVFFITGYW